MQAYVFSSLAQAQSAVAAMDAGPASGGTGPYPKAGQDTGGGTHSPPSQSQTLTYGAIWQHPTLAEWAYMQDATSGALLPTKIPVPSVQNIDFTGAWAGATQVWP